MLVPPPIEEDVECEEPVEVDELVPPLVPELIPTFVLEPLVMLFVVPLEELAPIEPPIGNTPPPALIETFSPVE